MWEGAPEALGSSLMEKPQISLSPCAAICCGTWPRPRRSGRAWLGNCRRGTLLSRISSLISRQMTRSGRGSRWSSFEVSRPERPRACVGSKSGDVW